MEVKRIKPTHYESVFLLMQQEQFPDVPEVYAEAKPFFEESLIYGLFPPSSRQPVAAFVFGGFTGSAAFLDVVCAKTMRSRWAQKGVLRFLYSLAFEKLGLDFVWAQPRNKTALKAVLAAGFVLTPEKQNSVPTVVLSKTQGLRRLNKLMNQTH